MSPQLYRRLMRDKLVQMRLRSARDTNGTRSLRAVAARA